MPECSSGTPVSHYECLGSRYSVGTRSCRPVHAHFLPRGLGAGGLTHYLATPRWQSPLSAQPLLHATLAHGHPRLGQQCRVALLPPAWAPSQKDSENACAGWHLCPETPPCQAARTPTSVKTHSDRVREEGARGHHSIQASLPGCLDSPTSHKASQLQPSTTASPRHPKASKGPCCKDSGPTHPERPHLCPRPTLAGRSASARALCKSRSTIRNLHLCLALVGMAQSPGRAAAHPASLHGHLQRSLSVTRHRG